MHHGAYIAWPKTINFHIFEHLVPLHYISCFWVYAHNRKRVGWFAIKNAVGMFLIF